MPVPGEAEERAWCCDNNEKHIGLSWDRLKSCFATGGTAPLWRRDGTCWYCGCTWHDCSEQVFRLGVTVFMLTEGLPCKKCAVPGPGSLPPQSHDGPADEVSDMASGSWCCCRMACEGICSWACWVGMGSALGLKSLPAGGATLVLPRVSQSQKPYILYKTHKLSR